MADTGGRVTMPFLPTLATVVVLAAASFFCSKQDAPAPSAAARMIQAEGGTSLAMIAPLAPSAEPTPRRPAVIAFAEVFPLTAEPSFTAALPAQSPSAATPQSATAPQSAAAPQSAVATPAPRPPRKVASSLRRPCAGRRCPETGAHDGPAQDNPFQPARTASEEPAGPSLVPAALPFAETVVEAVIPVAREVGARVERISGGARDLVRGGQAVMKGSVSALADRLF